MTAKKYPVGIQTFSEVIRGGYVYVDKTDLVWELANYRKYIFLSRPRRFGKSLLTTTLESYFRGEKALFQGLKIMALEQKWESYPVIRLDLSRIKGLSLAKDLQEQLFRLLLPYEELYGVGEYESTPGSRLDGLIHRAYKNTGKQVVILIDEYDAALLDVLHDQDLLASYRQVMQEFYNCLKPADAVIHFCFLTGITRLSQLNIFSTLNNLTNVSLLPKFASVCGITENEIDLQLTQDIASMAEEFGYTPEQLKDRFKTRYDGYHFSSDPQQGVYNPYSLLSALANRSIANYWFETGTPSFLIWMMKLFRYDITRMDDIQTTDYAINRPTEAMTTMVPLLYQTGYLTIKDYDAEGGIYTLGIPNQEVRTGYADGLLPAYSGLEGEDVQAGFALKFWRALQKNNLELALREMQAYLAGIPYVEGFKKKLAEAATAEGFYEYTLYLVFSMLNVYVRTQVKCAGGRTDAVVWMPDTTYVLELKTNGTAEEALAQIDSRGYALPYRSGGRHVVKAGIRFDLKTRTLADWVISSEPA